ncbi:lytic transglycosylase domain-containing protein [Sphingomonas sp. CL5.1]|uniref:lytic transglycosylase domain-containing protein n=1 Tax=Sphingomonas sp. CL5.1 TaxID=2653203 RepID=UPI001582DA31|nr:lytic transglycosylase domain-containing protein [Sphingomonas sp. CL5.1]QKR98275.1 lytic transglycosylase domain-containing protein [Sphingomonas sp. CL5.1]
MSAGLRRAIVMFAVGAFGPSAPAAARAPSPTSACLAHVPEASARSGLPADFIVRVMIVESGGNPRALSAKGAMGCMQIMPATWAILSARYALGGDPWDARANMIAGSLYLAELIARYAIPGALAAYNAGEGRWQRYRDNGTPLPAETVAYIARIESGARDVPAAAPEARWQEAALFMPRGDAQTPSGKQPAPSQSAATSDQRPEGVAGAATPKIFPLSTSRATQTVPEREP